MGRERGYKVNDCLNKPIMVINKTQMDGVDAFIDKTQKKERERADACTRVCKGGKKQHGSCPCLAGLLLQQCPCYQSPSPR